VKSNLLYKYDTNGGKSEELRSWQARSQGLRFGREKLILGGKDFCFIICLKLIFLGTTKFGGHWSWMHRMTTGLVVGKVEAKYSHKSLQCVGRMPWIASDLTALTLHSRKKSFSDNWSNQLCCSTKNFPLLMHDYAQCCTVVPCSMFACVWFHWKKLHYNACRRNRTFWCVFKPICLKSRHYFTLASRMKSPRDLPLGQGSPNNGPRAKSGPQSHFGNNEKIFRKICWFGRM